MPLTWVDSPGGGLGGMPARRGGGPPGGAEAEEQQAQQDEMKRQLLSQILDNDARERRTYVPPVVCSDPQYRALGW